MQAKNLATLAPTNDTGRQDPALNDAVRDYVRPYALWHGRPQAARLSRHSLWWFMERGRLGRSLPGRWATPSATTPAPSLLRRGP